MMRERSNRGELIPDSVPTVPLFIERDVTTRQQRFFFTIADAGTL